MYKTSNWFGPRALLTNREESIEICVTARGVSWQISVVSKIVGISKNLKYPNITSSMITEQCRSMYGAIGTLYT